jgi:2-amino-4-hydroxy-6-hydroxymethyldihydropteridine diphosphokinase
MAGDARSQPETDIAWLSLGSNVGNRGAALTRLRLAIASDGVVIEAASAEILTRPVGVTNQPDFHNQVLRARSPAPWPPERWLAHCKAAEVAAGRRQTYRWGPRIADADVVLLGIRGEVLYRSAQMQVPHPELRHRPFLGRLLAGLGLRLEDGRPVAGPP